MAGEIIGTSPDRRPKVAQHAVLGLEFLHFWSCELAGGRHFAVFGSTNSLSCASPGLQSGEAGFQTRENVPVYKLRALALVAGRSNSILRDADDQANSSGLSLNLTGFSQM